MATFANAKLCASAIFRQANFTDADFAHTCFESQVQYQNTRFNRASFIEARFGGLTEFTGAQFAINAPDLADATAVYLSAREHVWPPEWQVEQSLVSSSVGFLVRRGKTPEIES